MLLSFTTKTLVLLSAVLCSYGHAFDIPVGPQTTVEFFDDGGVDGCTTANAHESLVLQDGCQDIPFSWNVRGMRITEQQAGCQIYSYAEPNCPFGGDDWLNIPVSCYYNSGKQFRALKLTCSSSSVVAPVASATASGDGTASTTPAQTSTTTDTTAIASQSAAHAPTTSGESTTQQSPSASSSDGSAEDRRIALGVGIGIGAPGAIVAVVTLWKMMRKSQTQGQSLSSGSSVP